MNFLYYAALAKAAKDYKKRHSKPISKIKGYNIEESSGKTKEVSNVTSMPEYTYLDYLLLELTNDNDKLFNFFNDVYEEYQKIVDKFKAELTNKQKAIEEEIDTKIADLQQALSAYPLEVKKYICSHDDAYAVFGFLVDGVAGHGYNFKSSIMGLENEAQNKCARWETQISTARFWINETERSFRFAIMPKRKKQKQERLDTYNEDLNEGKRELQKAEKWVEKIAELIKLIDIIGPIYDKVEEEVDSLNVEWSYIKTWPNFIKHQNPHLQDYQERYRAEQIKHFESAISAFVEKNNMKEEDFENLFLAMDKVELKARSGEYKFSSDSMKAAKEKCEHLKPLIEWFIKNIYKKDEHFVERNIDLAKEDKPLAKKKK